MKKCKFIIYTLLGICGAIAASALIVFILKKISHVDDVEGLSVNNGEAAQLTGSDIPEIQEREERPYSRVRRGYISIPLGRQ